MKRKNKANDDLDILSLKDINLSISIKSLYLLFFISQPLISLTQQISPKGAPYLQNHNTKDFDTSRQKWMIILVHILLIYLFFIGNLSLCAQEKFEIGIPFIKNYSPKEYGAFDQNWAAVQDDRGIMYFANGDGILTYNGKFWNVIELPNKGSVFFLFISKNNTIYVGGREEFGFLESNDIGELKYKSLLPNLSDEYLDFGAIKSIDQKEDKIFFGSNKYIFIWDDETITSLNNTGDSFLFSVNDELYKRIEGIGLTKFVDNDFELVQDGEVFKNKKIYAILPYKNSQLLIVTANGLFTYVGERFLEVNTDFSDFFNDNVIYCASAFNENYYALGSLHKGILLVDKSLENEVLISGEELIRSDQILDLFWDNSGILWASLNSGIAKIEYPSPFSYFKNPQLSLDLGGFNNKLYAAGPEGLFRLKINSKTGLSEFEKLIGNMSIYDITQFEDKLLLASMNGVYEMDSKDNLRKIVGFRAAYLKRSKINPNRIYIGRSQGLSALLYENNKLDLEYDFEELNIHVDKIVETENGDLWLDIDMSKSIKISFDNITDAKKLKKPKVKTYTVEDGLPDDVGRNYLINGELYFASNSNYKISRYVPSLDQFVNDNELFMRLGFDNKKIKINSVDEYGNIWFIQFNEDKKVDQYYGKAINKQNYNVFKLNENRIIDLKRYGTFPELDEKIIWYEGKSGVIKHDLNIASNSRVPNTVLSKVKTHMDSTLYGGYLNKYKHLLNFKNNGFRFQFASTSFYEEDQNQFQYKLEGFDKDWSEWTSETQKDYTNIHEGDYTFRVSSKNIYGTIGREDSYSFTVLPPWYRTWWMYLIYTFLAVSLIAFFAKWYSKELRRKNVKLEGIVHERTLEIIQKNELLDRQTKELVQLNDSRTRFYSNISHEFRTPLTVIIGMVELLNKSIKESEINLDNNPINMIKRNGQKLLHLVNDLLDLSKLESQKMEMRLIQADIVPFVKYLSESFQSLAETKSIRLSVHNPCNEIIMDFDMDKMATIVSNLLSNAIKFTKVNGMIKVSLDKKREKGGDFFELKVEDNGIGISEVEMKNLFDRFYQVDSLEIRPEQGTGIGLSLVKEFVELMRGEIKVDSKLGRGSTFILRIPVTNNAEVLKDEQNIKAIESIEPIEWKDSLNIENVDDRLPLALLIDDNIDIIQYLKSCLYSRYQIISANNGIEGIELALKTLPDIIICDVMMPGKNGFEVCETLKSHEITDHIPIIMLTAKAADKDRIKGFSFGADAYLLKPFLKEELVARINQLITSRQKLLRKFENEGYRDLLDNRPENPEALFLKKVVNLINENIREQEFGPNQLAMALLLSDSQLYRKLKSITGKSVAIFMRSIRLQQGRDILRTSPDRNVSEVAYDVGFNDPSWFSKAFKEEFGIAPSKIAKP